MKGERYHGLDVLRVGMMFSVMITHAGLSYSSEKMIPWGNFQDPDSTNITFYFIFLVRHLFSMPVFFVLAGFFTSMTTKRYGVKAMLRSRTKRILLPLIVFVLLLSPIIVLGFTAAVSGSTRSTAFHQTLNEILAGKPTIHLVHLWFLYYLYMFCLVAYGVVQLSRHLPAEWVNRVVSRLDALITSPRHILIFGLISFVTLCTMYGPWIQAPMDLRPAWRSILVEGVFFIFGWRLYYHQEMLERFTQHPLRNLAISTVFLLGYLIIYFHFDWFPHYRLHTMSAMFMGAFQIWFIIPGLIGLSIKVFRNPSTFVKLLAQGSYWMYLIHMPMTIWLAYWMLGWQVSAFVKFGINLTTIFSVSFITYLLFVRSTFIGKFLNGKTYPFIFAPKSAPVSITEPVS